MLEGEIIKFYRKKAGLTQEQLGKDICTAVAVSKKENHELYKILFTLITYRIHNEWNKYYQYITETALPFFHSHHHVTHANKYRKIMYSYFVQMKQYEQAVEMSNILINDPEHTNTRV
ncbi:helix-turn-helix domain-containing protein [Mesobacillus sp. LC4]